MKKGDIVTVNDYSWCTHINGRTRNCKIQYVIIETGCTFPLCGGQDTRYRSDTVIKIAGSNEIVFIHENFLRPVPPKHKVMIDMVTYPTCGGHGVVGGQVVEISDKLYKEIKRDSQS